MGREDIIHMFPERMRERWGKTAEHAGSLQEIRLRVGRPETVMIDGRERFVGTDGELRDRPSGKTVCTAEDVDEILGHLCRYSLYAFADEIRQGFLTVQGGHRVGLAGQVILEDDGTVRNIKYVRYLNIRIAHEVKGISDPFLHGLYDGGGRLYNTLLISPPGCGKTTMLRDLIRNVSDGSACGAGMNVGVVDERSEIAGSYLGVAQNDVGARTDVLDGCPKREGMMMLVRSMTPQVLAVDELGGEEDLRALRTASGCGCRLLATVHGESLQENGYNNNMRDIIMSGLFDRYMVLTRKNGRCEVEGIYDRNGRSV